MEFTIAGLELPVRLRTERPMSDDELLAFSSANDALQIEREPNGELTIMSPTGGEAAEADAEILYQLAAWARTGNAGATFGPSAGFRLRDGSVRSPDAAFLSWPVWNAISREERRKFVPACPEFVIELRSPTDRLKSVHEKMQQWINNGAELAWLIDPERQIVEVYRPGQEKPDVLEGVSAVYGEGPVAGFVLELARIWQ